MNLQLHKIGSTMQDDSHDSPAEESDLLLWNKRILMSIGIWPKSDHNIMFLTSFVYTFIHVTMEYADLVQHIGNLENVLANFTETTIYTILLIRITIFHKNRILSEIIDAMNENCANNKYKSLREQKSYGIYNSMGKKFHIILVFLVPSTAILYYLKPLGGYLFTTNHGTTTLFVLPYRTRMFYEITDIYTYCLTYAYQAIAVPIITLGLLGTDGLLISLTLHVCGQLFTLAESIVILKKDIKYDHCSEIRSIVEQHLRLIWMAKRINTSFSTILLAQIFGCIILICLNGVNVIVNSERTHTIELITFTFYEASMLTFLYAYCFIGECLIRESKRVRDAFYQSTWYQMSTSQSKDLIICIAGSQKPLYLTAGKFYIFSLENFTHVLKTSMAYLSMLRTLM